MTFEQEIRQIAQSLSVSHEVAAEVWDLRNRLYHTLEAEAELINQLMRSELVNTKEPNPRFPRTTSQRTQEVRWQYGGLNAPS